MQEQINQTNYQAFDNQILSYDTTRFSFRAWVEKQLKDLYSDVHDLQLVHEIIPLSETAKVTKEIIARTQRPEFQAMVEDFLEEYMAPLLLNNDFAIQRFQNFRLFRPDDASMKLPFHTGQLQGHGLGQRSIWMPLTPAHESASMYITDIETSRKAVAKAKEKKMSLKDMEEFFTPLCQPANIDYGQTVIFTQENLHGNVANKSGLTRVSFDFRVLIKGGDFYRKIPGGYFRLRSKRASA